MGSATIPMRQRGVPKLIVSQLVFLTGSCKANMVKTSPCLRLKIRRCWLTLFLHAAPSSAALLSISIDPDFDTPQRLQYYREAHKGDDKSWYLTRPVSQQQLRTIVKETGLRIIPDELGGYTHSESIHVLQNGKITSIYDWDTSGLELLITNAGTTEISQLDASIQ